MATMRRFSQSIEAGRMPDRLAEGLWDLIQGTDITAYNLYRRAVHNRPMVPKPDGVHQVYFLCQAEQAPNPDSRITLSDRRDALGSRLPVLDWRLGELDKRTLQVQGKLLGGEMARLGLGLFQFDPWLRDGGNSWSPTMVGGYHQMGTTRMSDDERTGVVDANCRVHGLENLYVAGSSVYPDRQQHQPDADTGGIGATAQRSFEAADNGAGVSGPRRCRRFLHQRHEMPVRPRRDAPRLGFQRFEVE